jgi:hypothetical protein
MSEIVGSIITDCYDPNARARQELAFTRLFGTPLASFLGVESELAASGNLVDQLGVLTRFAPTEGTQSGVILVNVAPRGSDTKQQEGHHNGRPFCYFKPSADILVVSTYDDCLAVPHDLGIVESIELLDVPTVTAAATEWGLSPKEAQRINTTQFRSLEFLPLVAKWILEGRGVPSETQLLSEMPSFGGTIWEIDNFGNAKLTTTSDVIQFTEGQAIQLVNGTKATFHQRLADVPTGETALTIGSSGYKDKRFLELVIAKGKAAEQHNLAIGSHILKAVA